MRLYCVSQILRKGQIICSDLQRVQETRTLNMQSVISTINVNSYCFDCLKSICEGEDGER